MSARNLALVSSITIIYTVVSETFYDDDTLTLSDEYSIDNDLWNNNAEWDTINTLLSLNHQPITQKCIVYHNDHEICLCQFKEHHTKYLCSNKQYPSAKQSQHNYLNYDLDITETEPYTFTFDQHRSYLFHPSILDLISTIDTHLKANKQYIASYHLKNPTHYVDKSEKYRAAHVIYKYPIVLLSLTHMIDLFTPSKPKTVTCSRHKPTDLHKDDDDTPLPYRLQQMLDSPTLSLPEMIDIFSVSQYFVTGDIQHNDEHQHGQFVQLESIISEIKLHIKHIMIKGTHDQHALNDLQTLINRFVGSYENHPLQMKGLRDWTKKGKFAFIGQYFERYDILHPHYGRYFGKHGSCIMYPVWMDGSVLKFFWETLLRFHKNKHGGFDWECYKINAVDDRGWLNSMDVWKRWLLIQSVWRYLQTKLLEIPHVIGEYLKHKEYRDVDKSFGNQMKSWFDRLNEEMLWIRGDGFGPEGQEITTNMIDIDYLLRDWIKAWSGIKEKHIPKPLTVDWLYKRYEKAKNRAINGKKVKVDPRDWYEICAIVKNTLNPKEKDRYQVSDFIKEINLEKR